MLRNYATPHPGLFKEVFINPDLFWKERQAQRSELARRKEAGESGILYVDVVL